MRPTARRLTALALATLPFVLVASAAADTATSAAATAVRPAWQAPRSGGTVNVVGYSIAAAIYNKEEAAFQSTPAGKDVTFTNSFGASTTQADNVVAGQPADVVNFSTSPDMELLVRNGLVASNWASSGPGKAERGNVADSYVVIVVRKGNPLGVTGWGSLTKKSVQIVTPDPISSGSARWNLLGAYESQVLLGRTSTQAYSYTNALVHNVVAQPSSGSKALSAFLAGTGNVLLTYESDAAAAVAKGDPLQIVYPQQNILIETPAALTTTGAKNPAAEAFLAFLFSKQGQVIFAHSTFRPTVPAVVTYTQHLFPKNYAAKDVATIGALGGWGKVARKFFSANGIITQIERANGHTS